MDPNLFRLDWERTFEALVGIIVLSFFVERACAVLFESRWWIGQFEDDRVAEPVPADSRSKESPDDTPNEDRKSAADPPKILAGQRYPLKEIISFLLSLVVCWMWKFDAVSIVLLSEKTRIAGYFITAGVVAGGSKASIALFHRLLGVMSSATKERKRLSELSR